MKTPAKEFVHQTLLTIGNSLLKEPYKSQWNTDNPTLGYCYVVSEALYHYLSEADVHAYCMNLGSEIGTHWFVKVNGEIMDFTKEQFDFPLDYSKAVRKGFFKGGVKTPKGFISKRGYEIAKHLHMVN